TPAPRHGEEDAWLDALERALATGVRRVQLRAAGADPTGSGEGTLHIPDAIRATGSDPVGCGAAASASASAATATATTSASSAAGASGEPGDRAQACDPGSWHRLIEAAVLRCRHAGAEVLV